MRILVAGAGISGLVAAYDLRRAGHEVVVVDPSSRVGGVIASEREQGYLLEAGPVGVQGEAPEMRALAGEIGLGGDLLSASPDHVQRHIYWRGHIEPLPRSAREFLRTPLFTWPQKLRALLEEVTLKRPTEKERSVAEFFGRRVGREITSMWVDVLASELYAGNPNHLSIQSAFPRFYDRLKSKRSVFRAFLGRARDEGRAGTGGRAPPMTSFRGGMGQLVSRLGERLDGALRLGTTVEAVRREEGRLRVTLRGLGEDRETLGVDRLLLAIPAPKVGILLSQVAPTVADLLFEVVYASIAVAQAGFHREQIPGLKEGRGFLVPRCMRMRTLGWTFASNLFPSHAPEDRITMTGTIGGILDPHAVDLGDARLRYILLNELALAFAQKRLPRPDLFRVVRWREVLPQYNLGHRRRVDAVKTILRMELPGVGVTGSWVDGLTVEECIAEARRAAASLAREERP